MKTAKEMFEELGFYQFSNNAYCVYYKHEKKYLELTFYHEYKNCSMEDSYETVCVDPKLTLAIVQQMKELGWID